MLPLELQKVSLVVRLLYIAYMCQFDLDKTSIDTSLNIFLYSLILI